MAGMGRIRAGAVAVGCVVVLAAGCGAGRPAPPAAQVTSPAAGGPPAGPQRRVLAARYLAIARAGNRRLEIDFGRLDGRDRSHLTAAEADLRDAASTERLFDRRLMRITFPPATETAARLLYRVNQSRARLTAAA